jgi:hypothetical protein
MLASIARRLFKTFASITAPCSVKAKGGERRPPRPSFEVADRDLKRRHSASVSLKTKSSGKRAALRFHCWLTRLVIVPYSAARSESSMTLQPRTTWRVRSILAIEIWES